MITKQDILEYVMNSPYNTNLNVLSPMLEEYGEGGGSGGDGVFIANVTYDEEKGTFTLDKTWQEIFNANVTFIVYDDGYGYHFCNRVVEASEDSGLYSIGCDQIRYISDLTSSIFETDSANGYPVLEDGK